MIFFNIENIYINLLHMLHWNVLTQIYLFLSIQDEPPMYSRILLLVDAHLNIERIVTIEMALERAGGRIMRVSDHIEAEYLVRRWEPEVMVVLGWSSETGDWIRQLKSSLFYHVDLPFVVVGNDSEKSQEEKNAIMALEMGAQAYIPETMGLGSLTAQVTSLVSKINRPVSFGSNHDEDICIDLVSLRAWILGNELHIPRQLFYLLNYFITHPNEVVSKEKITDILWDGKRTSASPNAIMVKIYQLRKLLQNAGAKDMLETVHGFGYRFTPKNRS